MFVQFKVFGMKNLIILCLGLTLTSCATLFNKPAVRVDIHTKSPALIVVNKDTIPTNNGVASFIVPRSKKPLQVESIADTISKTYQVKSRLSPAFCSNVFFFYGVPGVIIDGNSNKIFGYPEHILLNPTDSKMNYKIMRNQSRKGELYLNLSIPEFNFMHQYTRYSGYVNNAGCMGISGGLDYYYKPFQFVNFSGAIALTYDAPIPMPLEYFGSYETANTKYVSFSNNHRFYFLSFGYGLSFSQNVWNYNSGIFLENFGSLDVHKKNYALGFVFPLYFKIGHVFNLGFIYRPSFYCPYSVQPFKYEHLMSVDFAWKFRVKR